MAVPHGTVAAGMAWRVKYRLNDNAGKVIRIRTFVEHSGTHRGNRGGVYPGGVRCKSLALDVLDAGVVKEEMNHALVAVEETPTEHIRDRGEDYVSGATYNRKKCAEDELLITCFEPPCDAVNMQWLSHNHMLIVCRAFMTGAKWDLPPNEAKGITFCDDKGRLSLTAVAAHPNGKELGEVIAAGLDCECLSWKMDIEEPSAASVISLALNRGHEIALRTTELTAVAVLKGEIIAQLSNTSLGQRVAFQTVRERVRQQLDVTADDPDLPEVFDFLISGGVGTNTYIDDLLKFCEVFVDSKKRQLRFSAFAVPNQMCVQAQWSRIAVIKRAYRKKPTHGFCPSPEPAWKEFGWDELRKLEELLRFFHAECKPLFESLTPQSRDKLMANIDVTAADAFFAAKGRKQRGKALEDALLESVAKYLEALKLEGENRKSKDDNWIDWCQRQDAEEQATEKLAQHPTVIKFDQETGDQINQQVDFTPGDKADGKVMLPWRDWYKWNKDMGAMCADKAAAVAVLHSIHENYDVRTPVIEMWNVGKGVFVVATTEVAERALLLPPCVPKQSKVVERTEHPHAVEMGLKVIKSDNPDTVVDREQTFWVLPEFKCPEQKSKDVETAVAAAGSAEWIWSEGSAETMHPFWAVRRMTNGQLLRERADRKPGEPSICFNCELRSEQISVVTIGMVNNQVTNLSRLFEVPFLTNKYALLPGEELLLQIDDKKQGKAKKRTWRDADRDQKKADGKEAQVTKKRMQNGLDVI